MELVTAVLVTRGDVDMQPVLDSLPPEWPVVVWDNSGLVTIRQNQKGGQLWHVFPEFGESRDLSVYGRYAGLTYVTTRLAFVCDDDVIVSNPQAIVDAWQPGHVVCNMPQEFRHDGYTDSALVGFGACFERDLPDQAFRRFGQHHHYDHYLTGTYWDPMRLATTGPQFIVADFARECDTVFTMLTPRILVDVPKVDREFASDPDRLWKQPEHIEARELMRKRVRQVRDS